MKKTLLSLILVLMLVVLPMAALAEPAEQDAGYFEINLYNPYLSVREGDGEAQVIDLTGLSLDLKGQGQGMLTESPIVALIVGAFAGEDSILNGVGVIQADQLAFALNGLHKGISIPVEGFPMDTVSSQAASQSDITAKLEKMIEGIQIEDAGTEVVEFLDGEHEGAKQTAHVNEEQFQEIFQQMIGLMGNVEGMDPEEIEKLSGKVDVAVWTDADQCHTRMEITTTVTDEDGEIVVPTIVNVYESESGEIHAVADSSAEDVHCSAELIKQPAEDGENKIVTANIVITEASKEMARMEFILYPETTEEGLGHTLNLTIASEGEVVEMGGFARSGEGKYEVSAYVEGEGLLLNLGYAGKDTQAQGIPAVDGQLSLYAEADGAVVNAEVGVYAAMGDGEAFEIPDLTGVTLIGIEDLTEEDLAEMQSGAQTLLIQGLGILMNNVPGVQTLMMEMMD